MTDAVKFVYGLSLSSARTGRWSEVRGSVRTRTDWTVQARRGAVKMKSISSVGWGGGEGEAVVAGFVGFGGEGPEEGEGA